VLDFKLIPSDEFFERFCVDLIRAKGLVVAALPARRPDGRTDIVAVSAGTDELGFRHESRILIECKHYAPIQRSVREGDVQDIVERTLANNCNTFLLVTSTLPSSSLASQLGAISANPSVPIVAACWSSHDLERFVDEFPELRHRYFSRQWSSALGASETPSRIIAIHLHPDLMPELQRICEEWNSRQTVVSFLPIRPPRDLEADLLLQSAISCDGAEKIAALMKDRAGFGAGDGIIQFCEGRLYDNDYYQLFSWTTWIGDSLDTCTISLNMKRRLAKREGAETSIMAMILQSMLYALGLECGLEWHDVTRTCIMDFDDVMPDILLGLEHGPRFCPQCTRSIRETGYFHLLELAAAARDFVHKGHESEGVPRRMQLRERRNREMGRETYDVALSFAGEDRECARQLASELEGRGVSVFYDDFEKERLWGEDLYTYLDELYRVRAVFCVMFVSEHYAKKLWTNHERRSAQARAFTENRAYILPIRLDRAEVPGLPPTVGYLNWHSETVSGIADILSRKVREYRDMGQDGQTGG